MSAGDKAAVRVTLRERLSALDPAGRAATSAQIAARVQTLPEWGTAHSVLLFVPLRDEPDLGSLLDGALASGRRVALPAFLPDTGVYAARWIQRPDRDLSPGRFGVPEPRPECPPASLAALDLALVPGLGFTRNGLRLGRGGGFYDRLLRDMSAVRCGVCRDEQVLDRLPVEPHDVRLQIVVTPSAVYRVADGPGVPHGS